MHIPNYLNIGRVEKIHKLKKKIKKEVFEERHRTVLNQRQALIKPHNNDFQYH